MPRKQELTWDKKRGRWKKKYHGQQFYFPFGENKADQVGYDMAVEAWHKKKAEIDGQQMKPHAKDYAMAIRLREELAAVCLLEGEHELHQQTTREIKELRRLLGKVQPPQFPERDGDRPGACPAQPHPVDGQDRRLSQAPRVGGKDAEGETARADVERYLALKREMAEAGQVSLSSTLASSRT